MSDVVNKHIQISKTDYLSFRFCRKNLWLEKNRPIEFKRQPLSEFELALVKEGQDVDGEAQNLFPEGIVIDGKGDKDAAIAQTRELMKSKKTLFQAAIASEPFYIRADVLRWNDTVNGWEIREIKATTQVKREKFNSHVYDLAFQYNVCARAGIEIKKVSVTHLNSEYRKDGEINYNQLFISEDITEEVMELHEKVAEEMELMIAYLNGPEEKYCPCRLRTRNNHCTTFQYSNPDVPSYAVHDITRINAKKLTMLVDDGCLNIADVPDTMKLSDGQMLQVLTAKKGEPHIDEEAIADFLRHLEYPLYFIDYESYLPAIPIFDRYGPYQNIVFQYSLHIMRTPGGELEHSEFLATTPGEPSRDLVATMRADIGNTGSVIVWHKPFEMGRNKEMAQLNPTFAQFLMEVNDRVIDLKEVFSKSMYIDPKFKGSASIKKVLPVLVPELSYKELAINNGANANKKWGEMMHGDLPESEKQEVISNLLVYCKQDTFAMVKIFQYLQQFI